jgi:hypothetical protein
MASTTTNMPESPSVSERKHQLIDDATPSIYKPNESLYSCSSKSTASYGSPNSLNLLMSRRRNSFQKSVGFSLERAASPKKADPSAEDLYGYGYEGYGPEDDSAPAARQQDNECTTDTHPPANKRRRFQRRNSKTPAMLLAMNSPLLLQLDFLEDKKDQEKDFFSGFNPALPPSMSSATDTSTTESKVAESWDGGLEIAEELVKHLQKRRKS